MLGVRSIFLAQSSRPARISRSLHVPLVPDIDDGPAAVLGLHLLPSFRQRVRPDGGPRSPLVRTGIELRLNVSESSYVGRTASKRSRWEAVWAIQALNAAPDAAAATSIALAKSGGKGTDRLSR